MSRLKVRIRDYGKNYLFFCPGCRYFHSYDVRTDGLEPSWEFNGDLEKPSFSPSLLVNDDLPKLRCHLFLREGKLCFLNDCFHELKGTIVDLPDVDEMGKKW